MPRSSSNNKGQRIQVSDNLTVAIVRGTPYEMGFQHGQMLKNEIVNGALPHLTRLTKVVAYFEQFPQWKNAVADLMFDWKYFKPLQKFTPKEYLDELKGISDGCGLSYWDVFRANVFSDALMHLWKSFMGPISQEVSAHLTLAVRELGCSSFIAEGAHKVFGRNTDYMHSHLIGKHQLVLLYEPQDGQRYACLTFPGSIKCNTGINESGIVIGGHFLSLTDISKKGGQSISFVGPGVMRKAKTVDEGIEHIRKTARTGGFAYMVASPRVGDSAVVESSAGNISVRKSNGSGIQCTNHTQTEDMNQFDLAKQIKLTKCSKSRARRLEVLLKDENLNMDAQAAIDILGDRFDTLENQEVAVGNVLGGVSCINSGVIFPDAMRMWVAEGPAPCWKNEYHELNISAFFERQYDAIVTGKRLVNSRLPQGGEKQSLEAYVNAIKNYPKNMDKVVGELRNATLASKKSKLIFLKFAQALLRDSPQKHSTEIKQAIEEFKSLKPDIGYLAEAWIVEGMLADLQGRREDALNHYKNVIENKTSVDAVILWEALKYTKSPYSAKAHRRYAVFFDIYT